jgi:hypothetical protein
MTEPQRPPRLADPARAPLAEVRRALLRLHKALIDSERAVFERRHGALTSGQLLSALLEDPHFQWLRPYSRLIADMDETLFSREPVERASAHGLVADAHRLLAGAGPEGGGSAPAAAGDRLAEVLRRDPAVHLAHGELTRRVAAALLAYGAG